ncbi:hypothetical protein AWJ20_576 [Sugiyamaella lignohabitans]|uniref:NAD(P)-binding protein n=1 Tax=Sugiyamaella lignohabitans TaxID=796027 RepID=A0A167D0G5_9ASCO|nr:uncharacterized protein AWJ20_576 [Sugiyamaella lignohabitans]ANB12326.1 hypothetical protein AWJ20_576 [Sugiyamaella lignohabitans]
MPSFSSAIKSVFRRNTRNISSKLPSTMSTVYVISGGNRGIGLAVVKKLSSVPTNIVITTARKPDQATELQNWVKSHSNVHVFKYDATVETDAAELAREVSKISDGVDVLIANSGAGETLGPVVETPTANWLSLYQLNTLGPILLFNAFYPLLLKRSTRKVLFTSTALGSKGSYIPVSSNAYGQSKAALNYTAKELSVELASQDFIIVPFHPGLVASDLGNGLVEVVNKTNPDIGKFFNSILISTEESANAIAKLADGLTKEDNGKFYNYDKTPIEW